MHIHELNGKRVCILGFGKEGQATLRAVEKYSRPKEIAIADENPGPAGYRLPFHQYTCAYGPGYLEAIPRSDVIIQSPGIPPTPDIRALPGTHTSPTQIFLDTIADTGATVIGVTGSKGKSTTSTLIYELLKADGRDVHLVGNIGKPAIDFLDKAKKTTIFVMEMSSYQLMDLTVSPHIAVVTSFFPEHLDYHGSLQAYLEAKKHIARFQSKKDIIVFNAQSDGAKKIAKESRGKKIPFSAKDAPIKIEMTHLLGRHNLSNIAAAFTVARELGIPKKTCIAVFKKFRGLPHRLEFVGEHHGIRFVDDAISTTPESTIAALDALGDDVRTIILGGQDRGNDFTELGKRILDSRIETVILFPGSGPKIREAIATNSSTPDPSSGGGGGNAPMMEVTPFSPGERGWGIEEKTKKTNNTSRIRFFEVSSMQQAVSIAVQETRNKEQGTHQLPIVLLSPASPSYGMFKNFEEKGEQFQKWIRRPPSPSPGAGASRGVRSRPRRPRGSCPPSRDRS